MNQDPTQTSQGSSSLEIFSWIQFVYALLLSTTAIFIDCISCRARNWFLGLWVVYLLYTTFRVVLIRVPKSILEGLWLCLGVPLQLVIASFVFSWPFSFSLLELVIIEIFGIFVAATILMIVMGSIFLSKGQFIKSLGAIPAIVLFVGLFWVIYIVYFPIIMTQYETLGSSFWWLMIPYLSAVANNLLPIKSISVIASEKEENSYNEENFVFSKPVPMIVYTVFIPLWFFLYIGLLGIFCPST